MFWQVSVSIPTYSDIPVPSYHVTGHISKDEVISIQKAASWISALAVAKLSEDYCRSLSSSSSTSSSSSSVPDLSHKKPTGPDAGLITVFRKHLNEEIQKVKEIEQTLQKFESGKIQADYLFAHLCGQQILKNGWLICDKQEDQSVLNARFYKSILKQIKAAGPTTVSLPKGMSTEAEEEDDINTVIEEPKHLTKNSNHPDSPNTTLVPLNLPSLSKPQDERTPIRKERRGRPKGSKNKPKPSNPMTTPDPSSAAGATGFTAVNPTTAENSSVSPPPPKKIERRGRPKGSYGPKKREELLLKGVRNAILDVVLLGSNPGEDEDLNGKEKSEESEMQDDDNDDNKNDNEN
ncbi:hypothetical protein UCRPC4_g00389 [Phaeomoniella chlamydospora]|uniref:Uncharacterized protein n=1 Tax=Phaeomoniella chlamydospora TaxID=158046 RepID=A0A0G2H0I0_PHACM|nr:hypothetical protein UCRPC4_g00389 [Phaeomoniella chlamydospora]